MSSPELKNVTEVTERGRRADAVRNRQRVLDAALEAFEHAGCECQMPEIAKRADVGVGTIYRHFPSKRDLLEALADRHFERIEELGQEALDSGLPPWEALTTFIRSCARAIVDNRGMAEVVAQRTDIMAQSARSHERLHEIGAELIRRAQETGDVRPDATVDDIPTIMCGLGHVMSAQASGAPMSWERYLTLMLDGLRPQPAARAPR